MRIANRLPFVNGWLVTADEPFEFFKNQSPATEVDFEELEKVFPGKEQGFMAALALSRTRLQLEDVLRLGWVMDNGVPSLVFPEGGLESRYRPGMYHVPGASRYLISGEKPHRIISPQGKELTLYKGSDDYINVSVCYDWGSMPIGVRFHRLILLTFNHQGSFPRPKEANHKDHDKGNYDLDNLDWLTPSQNQMYSKAIKAIGYNPGLSSVEHIERFLEGRTKPSKRSINNRGEVIRVHDAYTGEIKFSGTPTEVAGFLDTTLTNLGAHMRSDFQGKTICGGFRCTTKDEVFQLSDTYAKASYSRRLKATNLQTGETTLFDSASEFQRVSGLSRKQVFGRLERRSKTACNGWLFEYVDKG